MKISVILLVLDLLVWGLVVFTFVLTSELAISPLSYIKRNLLVNMSKRKFDSFTSKDENSSTVNDEETTLEDDNKEMKKIEKIIFKFRLKYFIIFTILVIATLAMMFIFDNHLDYSTILVSIISFCCVVYALTKFMALRTDMKEQSYKIVAKKLKLDEKFVKIIKENTK